MPTRTEGEETAARSPEDVFALLGNETRVGILRALWEAHDPAAPTSAVPFSELSDRVGADDTGNFNYHLGKLTGHFVRRTDEGYELTAPGFRIVRAVVAGGVTGDPTLPPTPVDATCGRCESPVEMTYEDGLTWVRCTTCEGYWPQRGGEIFGFGLPPEGLRDRDPDEILRATVAYAIHRFETMSDGVCPECGAAVDASLAACDDHETDDGVCDTCGSFFQGVVTYVCGSCKFAWRCPSYAPVSAHPAVVSFYDDHGIEHVPATWEGVRRGLGWREEPLATDPPSLRLTVACRGDRLHLVLDEAATVVDVSVDLENGEGIADRSVGADDDKVSDDDDAG
jgi:hypothetical protein